MQRPQKTKKLRFKKLLLILLALLILAGACFAVYKILSPKPVKQSVPKSTVTSLPKTTSNAEKQIATPSGGANQGNASNTPYSAPKSNSSPSQWAASNSGKIVVQQPLMNGTVASGFTLSGTSSVNPIQYRLIDDASGVISEGPLQVADGKFSATVNYQNHGKTGRLDVFSMSDTGAEINEVQLQVTFQ